MKFISLIGAAALFAIAGPVTAQTVLSGDHSVDGRLCVGNDCTGSETFTSVVGLKIKQNNPGIRFEDTSTSSFPDRDWRIEIAGLGGLSEYFGIRDLTLDTLPFRIDGGADTNSINISTLGQVGFGTSMPESQLHIISPFNGAGIIMEKSGASPAKWDTNVGGFGYVVTDLISNATPFFIENGAPEGSISVAASGNTGLGTNNPLGKLHVASGGVQLSYFESTTGGPVQVRFRTDSENRRFLAVNNANEVKSQIIFLDDRINFTGQTDSGANLWLSIGPDGITSQGPTCGTPCDLTFDPEVFTVPPIAERAAYMWDNMHLPAIGPTNPETPINLTEKMGGVIHELEVAHIYIAEQDAWLNHAHQQIAQQSDIISEQAARLSALEAQMAELLERTKR